MDRTTSKGRGPAATRRNVLVGLVAGAGASAALLSRARAQGGPAATQQAGPVLFKRNAETERYYGALKRSYPAEGKR